MDHADIAKKLCEKCDVDSTLAYDALERAGWDILDAIIVLEREGVIAPITASTSTSDTSPAYGEVRATACEKMTLRDRLKRRK